MNKRKNVQNKNEAVKAGKKFKSEGIQRFKPLSHDKQKKQNLNNKNQLNQKQKFPQKTGNGLNNEKPQLTPSSEKPKLKMFGGTGALSSTEKKKEKLALLKKDIDSKDTGKSKNKLGDSNVPGEATSLNRHKRRREKRKHKRLESRQKLKELKSRVFQGDAAAVAQVKEKIKTLENLPQQSKTCKRKIMDLKKLVEKGTGKQREGGVKQKNVATIKQNQTNKNKQPKGNTQNQQKSKQLQGKKEQKPEESEDDSDNINDLFEEKDETDSDDIEKEADEEVSEESVEEEVSEESVEEEVSNEELSEESLEEEASNEEISEEGAEEESDEEKDDSDEEENEHAINKQINKKKQNQKINKNKNQTAGDALNLSNIIGKEKLTRYVVFVGNLPYTITKEEIQEHFKKTGEIVDIRIPSGKGDNKPKGFAYVELKNEESYQKALSQHHTFIGGRRINVFYTQSGKKKSNVKKNEIKAKNMKLQAMRKQGQLTGSVKADQKRSVRRAKKKQFEKN